MSLNKIFKNYYLETILILIIFFLDRISKLFVIHQDKLNFNSEIYSSKFLNIHLIWNEGIAFGLFSFNEDYLYNFLTFLIFLVIIFIIFMIRKSDSLRKYALLLVLGGALGNFFDRLIYKAVPDFIDFHVGNFHWFIFNVSDIFITIGVLGLIIFELIHNNKKMSIKILKSFITFVSLSLLFSGCSTISELAGPKNKNNSQEFLVEKKPPLSMPPNFNELPLPQNENLNENEIEEKNIKQIIDNQNKNEEINNNKEKSPQDLDVNNNETVGDLEQSLIDKIKKN